MKEHTSDISFYPQWVFTLGLGLSAGLDVLVASALCYYLRKSRSGFSSMDGVLNTLTFYTIQNGSLTFIATLAALVCWVTMTNLIFLALHFVITKLYANALLSTLNARKTIRIQQTSAEVEPSMQLVISSSDFNRPERSRARIRHNPEDIPMTTKVQINVEETVHTDYEHEEQQDTKTPL
ncbi:uncharacterized protein FIBRA_05962 [Fibroporia radiculosa]|uniref:DUF6534 domain-containing protein n=1 Tax=Fibroporia radiculosa TaxID=599839 RepID=J4GAF1_9APHY|nr:uncharacterized protein FIBRA_05962 [Fibroporia radiculosa]CCM03813.1 predicted protein [Fibroporia radiculosa]